MPKNIILCADGTGNEGGHTPDSNVFKMFNAIDIHSDSPEQIAFYDNGVGTQRNKYSKAFSGALGFGFGRNVKDLYEFLSRHYEDGDKIYLFGFSRGAATIRAFNGFVAACGLIDGRDSGFQELKKDIKLAMKAYRKPKQKDAILSKLKMHKNTPTITAIGVWDTVAALGLPHKVIFPISLLFKGINYIFDKLIVPYRFYNYELTDNVERAYHAISIDDERKSFWPKVWKENTQEAKAVKTKEQVWFTGMHSSVGGGYERAGLSNICLHWMMTKVPELKLKDGVKEEIYANSDSSGRMYNSRNGAAVFYRYGPRDIAKLCNEAGVEIVKVYETVEKRLKTRIANYAPTLLPQQFKIVDDNGDLTDSPSVHEKDWNVFHKQMHKWISVRKFFYGALIALMLGFVSLAFIFKDINCCNEMCEFWYINAIDALTPDVLDGLIRAAFVKHLPYGIGAVIICIIFFLAQRGAKNRYTKTAERLRRLILNAPAPYSSVEDEEEKDGDSENSVDSKE